MKLHPPQVSTRDKFLRWTCEVHNRVNEKLGKEQFDCGIENLLKRWRKGDPSCWEESPNDQIQQNMNIIEKNDAERSLGQKNKS